MLLNFCLMCLRKERVIHLGSRFAREWRHGPFVVAQGNDGVDEAVNGKPRVRREFEVAVIESRGIRGRRGNSGEFRRRRGLLRWSLVVCGELMLFQS